MVVDNKDKFYFLLGTCKIGDIRKKHVCTAAIKRTLSAIICNMSKLQTVQTKKVVQIVRLKQLTLSCHWWWLSLIQQQMQRAAGLK